MGVMRLVDIMLAFPYVLLLLAIIAILGPSLITALIAVGIASIPGYARLVRAEALSVRETEYAEAMRVLGAGPWRITFGTILPNIVSPLVIYVSYSMPLAVLSAASLSFPRPWCPAAPAGMGGHAGAVAHLFADRLVDRRRARLSPSSFPFSA